RPCASYHERRSDPRPGGGSRRTVAGARAGLRRDAAGDAAQGNRSERGSHARRLHERTAGGRRPFRPPDTSLEPEDEALHLHRARRHLHHRPPADPAAARRRVQRRARRRRAQRVDPVRRHEEAGAGRRRRRGEARQHAVRQPPVARRPADELADDLRPDPAPARAAVAEAGGAARPASREGADRDGGRAREARGEPRRRRRHAPPAGRDLHHRPAQGAARGSRGPPARTAGDRARRHELRPRRGGLRHPRKRRRDPVVLAHRQGDRRRHRGGQAAGDPGGSGGAEERRCGRGAGGGCTGRTIGAGRRGLRRRAGDACGATGTPTGGRGDDGAGGGAMSEITASMVKELRDATGAGMMECKRALQETDGDFDSAVRVLREKGMASAAKRAERETTEGVVLVQSDDTTGTIVAIGCETEPVSKNDDFEAFALDVLREVHELGADLGLEPLEERRAELSGRLGENIRVVGARRMRADHGEHFVSYFHPPARKIGVLLKVRGGSPELPRELAMHIAFARPTYTRRAEVPAALVDAEREILSNSDEVLSKPENVREKIVEGMLNKRFYAESVLEEQAWIHDTSLTVKQALDQGQLELLDYTWYALG